MLGHVIWYITYRSCHMIHHIPSYHIINHLMSMGFTFYMIHHLSSCHILIYLPSMHGHVLWYITYHRCTAISFDTSPTIDARQCHMIHHLPSMGWTFHMIHHLQLVNGHVIWYITYIWCMVISWVHHLPSMYGYII